MNARDLAAIAGFCSFGVGMWLWFPPAAFVACGALLMAVSVVGHSRGGGS